MVQRKLAPDKVGSQGGQERMSVIIHHQDYGKTRGPEVKRKMMKKSRSFKLSDVGQRSLKSSSPSPSPSPPNYMKSTSCFDARKEESKGGASTYSGGRKTAAAAAAARTLTRTPSFKYSRAAGGSSAKKPTRVALCGGGGGGSSSSSPARATCSSTLKDSKFPSYLLLSRGGNEAEGASAVKVCPYTYCSLNGHLHKHASLPPLKRFLSVKRRALKSQKSSVKLAKVVPCCDDKGGLEEVEEVVEFFVEIYADTTTTRGKTGFGGSGEEEQAVVIIESLSEGSPPPQSDDETEGGFSGGSEAEMDWEEGKLLGLETEDEAQSSCEMDEDSNLVPGHSSEVEEIACFDGEGIGQVCDGLIDPGLCCNKDECEDSSEEEEEEGEEFDAMHITICNDESAAEELVQEGLEEAEEIDEDRSDQVCEVSQEIVEANKDDGLSLESDVSEEIASSDLSQSTVVEEINDIGTIDSLAQNEKIEISDGSEDRIDESESGREDKRETEPVESENSTGAKQKRPFSLVEQEISERELRNKWKRSEREAKDSDGDASREFNPREPNYLPLAADPEGERVDLKHQTVDERKNSEDWMIDRALQQAVNKLGPARKRRVALLVEAFETVTPIISRHHRYDHHPSSPVFQHAIMPIQACN